MVGSFDLQVDTTEKRAGIRDAFVVQHYKQGRTVSTSFQFPYLLVYRLTGSMLEEKKHPNHTELFVCLISSVCLIWGQVTYHQSKVPSKSEKQWQWLLFVISAFFSTADKQSCPHTPSNLKIKYKRSTLQVATILVAVALNILELAT